ncbi:MAG: inorganic diphosphatase [Bacteroidales bacterium]|nr:inorganic diphosphatase [Bacteroidales bacterium]
MNRAKFISQIILAVLLILFYSCTNTYKDKTHENKQIISAENSEPIEDSRNLLTAFNPLFEDGNINVVVEIPAGTLEKWEVDKSDGKIKLEHIDGKPRIINYLGYPGNYGMIPRTLLSKESGGDGDPLDVIVLGPPIERGSVVKCKLIGVLYLLDRKEQDDKLIAVLADSPLYHVNSVDELNENYNGITQILQLWFTNYKGPGKMESKGFGDKKMAIDILKSAIDEYQLKKQQIL